MNSCAFCGRANDSDSRFCIDCGKPLAPSAARSPASSPSHHAPDAALAHPSGAGVGTDVIPPTRVHESPYTPRAGARCRHCAQPIDPNLPFCAHCGGRTGATPARGSAAITLDGRDGATVALAARPAVGPHVALLDERGEPTRSFVLDRGEATIGRADGDIRFPDDVYLSPLHAQLCAREGQLWLRDLGSRNGSWVFLDGPARLTDGDLLLVGSQLLRFRRLGYPGPHPPEADSTRRMGSLTPSADIAVVEQLRGDGSVRDVLHLSPGRHVALGRETGDWVFAYDQTMSGRHAEIRSEDSEFVVQDCESRNGVALAVRGERALRRGQRFMLGDQILRVESM